MTLLSQDKKSFTSISEDKSALMHYSAPQVSKTAPTGEYLTTGSFMIRGNACRWVTKAGRQAWGRLLIGSGLARSACTHLKSVTK